MVCLVGSPGRYHIHPQTHMYSSSVNFGCFVRMRMTILGVATPREQGLTGTREVGI